MNSIKEVDKQHYSITDRDVWQLKLIKVKDNSNVHSVDGGQALESRGRRLT
jgi:hypothetical protein